MILSILLEDSSSIQIRSVQNPDGINIRRVRPALRLGAETFTVEVLQR